jgi:kynurenine formamidase
VKPSIDYEDHDRTGAAAAGDLRLHRRRPARRQGLGVGDRHADHARRDARGRAVHYFPTSGGERARTIDELPLDWFVRPGIRLDLRRLPRGTRIEPGHLGDAIAEAGVELAPFDIVLLWTGAEEDWDTPEYVSAGSGLGREATEWLLDQGVKVIGTDAWGLDRPFMDTREAFEREGDAGRIWEAHRVGIDREYCQIEKLHNLGALPGPSGYTVSCLPVKVAGASAGWCRAAAILP